jgi:NADH:ubiquinone oxidoreductase subunit
LLFFAPKSSKGRGARASWRGWAGEQATLRPSSAIYILQEYQERKQQQQQQQYSAVRRELDEGSSDERANERAKRRAEKEASCGQAEDRSFLRSAVLIIEK